MDAESIQWLETYLDKYQGTVVCITHDRYFLNNCAGWILELDRGKGYPHEGNYETFLEMKTKRLEDEKKADTTAAKAVTNELAWIRSYVPYFASGIFFCVPLSACFPSSFLFMTPLIHCFAFSFAL